MATFDATPINRMLADLFANGTGEAGLEVGSDPGLPVSEHIRIPASMAKRWVSWELDDPDQPPIFDTNNTYEENAATAGAITSGNVTIHEGRFWIKKDGSYVEIVAPWVEPHTYVDIRNFVEVNRQHVRADEFDTATLNWIHAVRFWSVAAGFVATSKSQEFLNVADPTSYAGGNEDTARFIVDYAANAFTACAARAASWRKTNHATGGDVVQGFPRRWLNKMGYIRTNPDRQAAARELRKTTGAFYLATHAASVHAILALMASEDNHHWADVAADFGLLARWDTRESAKIRMVPRTQVAGAALVVDSMVVLKTAIKEGIAPLISSISQVGALAAAHAVVENNGIAIATYSKWFLNGHPAGAKPVAFSQKDASFSDLVGELAVIGTTYYAGSTIAGSASLRNAANQMGDEVAKSNWAALAGARTRVSGSDMIAAVGAIKGASSTAAINKILSRDEAVIRSGVSDYNTTLTALARAVGMPAAVLVDADFVVATRAPAAPAPATAPVAGASGTA